jgi:hypothetical protein
MPHRRLALLVDRARSLFAVRSVWMLTGAAYCSAVHAGFASMLSNLGDVALDIPDARVHMQVQPSNCCRPR